MQIWGASQYQRQSSPGHHHHTAAWGLGSARVGLGAGAAMDWLAEAWLHRTLRPRGPPLAGAGPHNRYTENRNTSPFLLLFSNIGYRFYYNWWRAISWSWSAAEKWFWSILLKKMAPNWDLVPTKTSNEYRKLGRFFVFHFEFCTWFSFYFDFYSVAAVILWPWNSIFRYNEFHF